MQAHTTVATTSANITREPAAAIVSSALDLATTERVAMAFAIVDAGGHLVHLTRMDGAAWIAPEIATGKAWTAAAWRMRSSEQAEKARTLPQFAAAISVATHGRHTPQDGGVPIMHDGELIGAAGASGSTGQHDADIVARAIRAVLGQA